MSVWAGSHQLPTSLSHTWSRWRNKTQGCDEATRNWAEIWPNSERPACRLKTRRAALNLVEDAVRSREAMETLNVELRKAEESLKEADRRKNEFLATLAHELRTPLAPILNALQLLGLKRPADSDSQWGHALIERQVKQLSRLVNDLLDVSRISHGKVNLQTELVDLASVVRQAIEISRPLIDGRNHHLEVSLPMQITPVKGDPVRLVQVVSNLLNNAAKYTEDGGRIDLAVEENDEEAVIRVRDTGVGIAPAMLPHIFEIFTQLQGSVSRSESGLGIGLSLVSSLVRMHSGSVQAFSGGIGQGSEFIVRPLPLLQDAFQPALAPKTAGEKRPTPPRHILVVDDNKDAAESLAVLLRLVGHDVRHGP